jgi:hypothetical protein
MLPSQGVRSGRALCVIIGSRGDPLERLRSAVHFGLFRSELGAALERSDRGPWGRRPPYDPVLIFKVRVRGSG